MQGRGLSWPNLAKFGQILGNWAVGFALRLSLLIASALRLGLASDLQPRGGGGCSHTPAGAAASSSPSAAALDERSSRMHRMASGFWLLASEEVNFLP